VTGKVTGTPAEGRPVLFPEGQDWG
jgi:hypothetical protein